MPNSIVKSFEEIYQITTPETSVLEDAIFSEKEVALSMLRLDQVHEIISGNKFYKLIYFLEEAVRTSCKTIITFGGAYSNHLSATAYACKEAGINCIGIIRGEAPLLLSPTLSFCKSQNMQLEFITRTEYKSIEDLSFINDLEKKYGKHLLIPEGGYSDIGAKGASLITRYFKETYSHVCLAVGTATTFSGILNGVGNKSKLIGFDILKNRNDIEERLQFLKADPKKNYEIVYDYHFGGYAKKTTELLEFMNNFYRKHSIPLDFVYTGKMMFGVYDLISKNYFPKGSKILCLHTGGLQGNQSLPISTLIY